ncbi:unnamed protein product [Cochlearia groenlandica]
MIHMRKRKNESTYDEGTSSSPPMMMKKKKKKTPEELVSESEHFAQALGKFTKFTGEGIMKKFHYEKFEFHGNKYGLEDTVVLVSDETYNKPHVFCLLKNNKPHVAIIKDIYIQGKKGDVFLKVQWFYRPEDVEKRSLKKWKPRDSRDLFHSFHYEEKVSAHSVMYECIVHYVTEEMHVPNRKDHPGFVVQNAYHHLKKKLWNFADDNDYFYDEEEHEIRRLVAKTFSYLSDLNNQDIVDDEEEDKTRRHVHRRCNVANEPYYKSILEGSAALTGDSDRDNRMVELMEALENKCRFTKEKLPGDSVTLWPTDVIYVVYALEKVFYNFFGEDMDKYCDKVEVVADKLKKSRMLAESLFTGKLTLEEIVEMEPNELKVISVF